MSRAVPLRSLLLVVLALVAVSLTAAGSAVAARPPAARAGPGPAVAAPTPRLAWTARIVEPVAARAQPRERARQLDVLPKTAPFWGGPNVLLVTGVKTVAGERWLQVLLKRMPAESRGWIPASAALVARTDRRIVVDLSDRRLLFPRAGRTQLETSVVIGAPETPTPTGLFAVDAIADEPPENLLGPRVLALVAYSRALARYQGGIPQAAVHAADYLGDALGTAASHGCVRAPQGVVLRLIALAPRGTPVVIQR